MKKGKWQVKNLRIYLTLIFFFTIGALVNTDAVIVEIAKKIAKESIKALTAIELKVKNVLIDKQVVDLKSTGKNIEAVYNGVGEMTKLVDEIYDSKEMQDVESIIQIYQLLDNMSCVLNESQLLVNVVSSKSCYFNNMQILQDVQLGYSTDVLLGITASISYISSNKEKLKDLHSVIIELRSCLETIMATNESLRMNLLNEIQNQYALKTLSNSSNLSMSRF